MNETKDAIDALKLLLEVVKSAIEIGDWKVDGRCDPDMEIARAEQVLTNQPNQ